MKLPPGTHYHICVHEAGHAIVALRLGKHVFAIRTVGPQIMPGAVWCVDGKDTPTREEGFQRNIAIFAAGQIAETLVFKGVPLEISKRWRDSDDREMLTAAMQLHCIGIEIPNGFWESKHQDWTGINLPCWQLVEDEVAKQKARAKEILTHEVDLIETIATRLDKCDNLWGEDLYQLCGVKLYNEEEVYTNK